MTCSAIQTAVQQYGLYLFGSWFTIVAEFLHTTIGVRTALTQFMSATILTMGFGAPIAVAIYYFFTKWYLPNVERLIERQKIAPINYP